MKLGWYDQVIYKVLCLLDSPTKWLTSVSKFISINYELKLLRLGKIVKFIKTNRSYDRVLL